MATNIADITNFGLTQRHSRAQIEHRFFLAFAIAFPLITVLGFLPNYIFDLPYKAATPMAPIVMAHTLSMVAWIVLFSVQATLISAKKVRLHMTLGMVGVLLAAAMIPLGLLTGYHSLVNQRGFPGFTPEEFLIVPAGDMVTFAVLFAAAIYYRKNAAAHKRLMLVVMLNFLAPSTARMPLPWIPDLGAIWLFGLPAVIGLVILAADTYLNGKMNRIFAAGLAFMIASGPGRVAICRTEWWTEFARSLV